MRMNWLGLVVIAVGCSNSNGGPIPIGSLYGELASALCSYEAQCELAPDVATCEASFQINTNDTLTLVAAVNAGAVKYDASAARTCLDGFSSATCTGSVFTDAESAACKATFTGTVAMGGACAIGNECVGGAPCNYTGTCDPTTSCCKGTCGASVTPGQTGASCMQSRDCAASLYCSASKGNTCQPLATTAGAMCSDFDGCAAPLECDDTGTHTCVMPPATGAMCAATGIPCGDVRDYCDASTMKCTRRVAVGAACGGAGNVQCVRYAECTNNACVAIPTAGKPCTTGTMGQPCLNALQCTNSTCTLPPAGMACPLM